MSQSMYEDQKAAQEMQDAMKALQMMDEDEATAAAIQASMQENLRVQQEIAELEQVSTG